VPRTLPRFPTATPRLATLLLAAAAAEAAMGPLKKVFQPHVFEGAGLGR
jgi:hypothetical protein